MISQDFKKFLLVLTNILVSIVVGSSWGLVSTAWVFIHGFPSPKTPTTLHQILDFLGYIVCLPAGIVVSISNILSFFKISTFYLSSISIALFFLIGIILIFIFLTFIEKKLLKPRSS